MRNNLNQLPEPYYRLALKRQSNILANLEFPLTFYFTFDKTPEGHDFWWDVYSFDFKSNTYNFPEIPTFALVELEEDFVTPNVK